MGGIVGRCCEFCCLDVIISLVAVFFVFSLGLIIGAVVLAAIIAANLIPFILFTTILFIILLILLILKVCSCEQAR